MYQNEEIEFLPSAEVREHQNAAVRSLVAYLAQRAPFYRRRFAELRLSENDIRGVDDLGVIPPTTKEDLVAHAGDFLCRPPEDIREIVTTSGTTASPIYIRLTAGDLDRLAENEARNFRAAGLCSGDTVLVAVNMNRFYIAGLAYWTGLARIGAAAVRVGPGMVPRYAELISSLKPVGIVCVPSFLAMLARYHEEHALPLDRSTLKVAVLIGESLRDRNLGFSALGRTVSAWWPMELFSTYGNTEIQNGFSECAAHAGCHTHPDMTYVEILDEAGRRLEAGEVGELVVTTLGVEGMPLVRYRTGDMTFLIEEPCTCGRTAVRIGPILGRRAQHMKVKGTSLYPEALADLMRAEPRVADFVVEAFTTEEGADGVRVHLVVPAGAQTGVLEDLTERTQAATRVTPELRLTDSGALAALRDRRNMRKAVTFVDNRRSVLAQ